MTMLAAPATDGHSSLPVANQHAATWPNRQHKAVGAQQSLMHAVQSDAELPNGINTDEHRTTDTVKAVPGLASRHEDMPSVSHTGADAAAVNVTQSTANAAASAAAEAIVSTDAAAAVVGTQATAADSGATDLGRANSVDDSMHIYSSSDLVSTGMINLIVRVLQEEVVAAEDLQHLRTVKAYEAILATKRENIERPRVRPYAVLVSVILGCTE